MHPEDISSGAESAIRFKPSEEFSLRGFFILWTLKNHNFGLLELTINLQGLSNAKYAIKNSDSKERPIE